MNWVETEPPETLTCANLNKNSHHAGSCLALCFCLYLRLKLYSATDCFSRLTAFFFIAMQGRGLSFRLSPHYWLAQLCQMDKVDNIPWGHEKQTMSFPWIQQLSIILWYRKPSFEGCIWSRIRTSLNTFPKPVQLTIFFPTRPLSSNFV